MSTQNKLGKLITRFEIGFDNETKADIDALKAKIDELTRALSVKNDSHGDRLLAAMQAEAANDAPITHTPWENDLKRASVNDVDYLSGNDLDECVPHIDDVLDQRNWLSESVPQITQADMQLIFIKNLSECLIQRMHSMDRFSEDDYAIGGDKLIAWDIVIGKNSFNDKRPNFAIVIATSNIEHSDKSSFGIADLTSRFSLNQFIHTGQYVKISVWHNETYRTITEAELPAFRAALEACYA
ncbi:MAG: hypothetical protein L0G63_03295 [Psychrobacter sp.]|uniref:hypothetical protein n=1 Tax=Psychrobacter sp. TaxID=56811 RepID=UPI0026488640|nr:hypothetical protein [Psychrobacter sp.]MDN5619459.1 hypothetical protein [Psychrobacter sp.]MDN5619499.1 hypothetical protein [Psychrobacter sp.]